MSPRRPTTLPGLQVQHLRLRGAADAGLARRLLAAVDAELARRGLHRVDIGRLSIDAQGLAAQGPAGLQRLATTVAQRIDAVSGPQEQPT